MKALPLVLAASLVANAVLLPVALRRDTAPDSAAPAPTATTSDSRPRTGDELALPPEIIAALNGNDPEALRDLLRAAGLSDDMIRNVVRSILWKKYEARFKALNPNRNPDPDKPWWKEDRAAHGHWGGQTKAQRAEQRSLHREMEAEFVRLFGVSSIQNPWLEQRFSFLPSEKRQALLEIQQDYQELMGEINQDAQGFRLQSDTDQLRFLQAEQKRDIEALLTPRELSDFELRNSQTANQLRWKMTQYDATEQEYLAIFPLQKAFDEKFNDNVNFDPFGHTYTEHIERDQNYWKDRQAAEKKLEQDIRAIIGEERFAESVRRQDQDYQQLEAATRRLSLAPDTPQKLFALRTPAEASVQRIVENPALTNDQRKQELSALAADTRAQVRAALGEEGAQAYFKNNGMAWLKELEKGHVVEFRRDSPGYNTKSLPRETKKPAAK